MLTDRSPLALPIEGGLIMMLVRRDRIRSAPHDTEETVPAFIAMYARPLPIDQRCAVHLASAPNVVFPGVRRAGAAACEQNLDTHLAHQGADASAFNHAPRTGD